MSTAQRVITKLGELSPDQQAEVLRLVEHLAGQNGHETPRQSPIGLLADLAVDISAQEIDAARREMWSSFPREDID